MFFDHIDNAYRTLRRNRARTILTTLGIAIGIASVTCILVISSGAMHMIGGQIEDLGGRLVVVRPGIQTRDPNALTNPVAQQSFSTSTLTEADVQAIGDLKGINEVVPIMAVEGTLKANNITVKDNVVVATSPGFAKVANLTMKSGQFIDEQTDNNTAVIGEELSKELFDTDRPIGQVFTMRGEQFTVIGVIKRSNNPINFNNVDLNHAVVVSFDRGKLFHQGRAQIQQIDILSEDSGQLPALTDQINSTLLTQHLGEQDFTVLSGEEISRPSNRLFVAITHVMIAIAAISLFVGGIGIMNIMLVGVAERTREIGIRKAVGASHRTIMTQFLIESLMMSLVGGLIGAALGYALGFVISTFLYFMPVFTWVTACVALAMALFVGIFFGLYPAIKASRKDTIESLRQYH